jgi:L-iditol 2-dehydrogenase
MKAALLYAQEDLRLEEVALPPLEPYGLRVKILTCGICGSDARMFFTGPTPRYINPVILGHELAAEVVEMGELVAGYAPGDVVTLAPLIPCMICPACSRGQDNLCQQAQVIGCTVHGGMAEYMTVPSQMVLSGGVVHLPEGVDPWAGALTELVGCCLHGLEGMGGAGLGDRAGPGDRVLIIGDGPIGLTFLQLVRLMGAGYVATSGRRPRRRELALELGADEALDASTVDLTDRFEGALDVVVVAASNIEATAEAMELVRPGGHLLLFSGYTYGTTLPLEVNAVHYRELHLHGSIDCTVRDMRRAVKLLPQMQMDKLVTAAFPLDAAQDAFYASKERGAVKVVLEP